MNSTKRRCPTCFLSTDPDEPDFQHVRLGLDEPPEPLVCMCKPAYEIISSVLHKLNNACNHTTVNTRSTTGTVASADLSTCVITNVSVEPVVEVEMRMSAYLSEVSYGLVSSGLLGHADADTITEMGCSMWTGPKTNMIAKVRMRSNEGLTAKVVMSVCEIMPGYKIAISYEYMVAGEIKRPEYNTTMSEMSVKIMISGTSVNVIARRYVCEDTVSYSSEVEFTAGVTHAEIRSVMDAIVNMIGSEKSLRRHVDGVFMSEVRYADHDVIDVADLAPYKGTVMLKADGVKCYVFCYPNGFVITLTDADLTVISCGVAGACKHLVAITNKPDVVVGEMMVDGSVVYIDTLSTNGLVHGYSKEYSTKPVTTYETPPMITRKNWGAVSDVSTNPVSSVPFDGIVCVTSFRTLRLKKPTIDLLCTNGSLCMRSSAGLIPVAVAHEQMLENSIYEMTVSKSEIANQVVLTSPMMRLVKRMPNNADIVRRAFMSVLENSCMNTVLYDVTCMSFGMRSRVYDIAQSIASGSKGVIVIFGAGRLQEVVQMKVGKFSYILVDPKLDVTILKRKARRLRITPYDENTSMLKQVVSITSSPGSMLCYRGASETFITSPDVISTMVALGIPAVFSFSISYHIRVINTLRISNVVVVGCGFVHDNMPVSGVGIAPVVMKPSKLESGLTVMRSTFGKSVWTEPILISNSVQGMVLIRDSLPDVWASVDSSTHAIMSRAVIMY